MYFPSQSAIRINRGRSLALYTSSYFFNLRSLFSLDRNRVSCRRNVLVEREPAIPRNRQIQFVLNLKYTHKEYQWQLIEGIVIPIVLDPNKHSQGKSRRRPLKGRVYFSSSSLICEQAFYQFNTGNYKLDFNSFWN